MRSAERTRLWVFYALVTVIVCPFEERSATALPLPVQSVGTCAVGCAATYGANTAACVADAANCVVGADGVNCVDRCDRFLTMTQCLVMPHCEWPPTTTTAAPSTTVGLCFQRCSNVSAASCPTARVATLKTNGTTQTLPRVRPASLSCAVSTDGGSCVPACSASSSATTCAQRSGCVWLVNSTCVVHCNLLYTDAVSCNRASICRWLAALAVCAVSCSSTASTQSQCTASSAQCKWTGAACTERCDVQYAAADLTSCKANPSCNVVAANTTSPCQDSCSIGWSSNASKQATCLSASPRCDYDTATAACLQGCGTFATRGTCPTSRCTWTDALGCVQACAVHPTGLQPPYGIVDYCASRPHCFYDSVTSVCQLKCFALYFKNGDTDVDLAAACATDPSCTVVDGVLCREACATATKAACYAQPAQCAFHTSTARCYPRCALVTSSDPAACGYVPGCVWYASRGVCREDCSIFNYNASECLTATHCTWNATSLNCTAGCHLLMPPNCVQSHCDTYSGVCVVPCAAISSASACAMATPRCAWNANAAACAASCVARSAQTCAASPQCDYFPALGCQAACASAGSSSAACLSMAYCWFDTPSVTCRPRCDVKYVTSGASCDADVQCASVASTGECRVNCESRSAISNCSAASSDCNWLAAVGTCSLQCRLQYGYPPTDAAAMAAAAAGCAADADCTWYPALGACGPRCGRQLSATACAAAAGGLCHWASSLQTNTAASSNTTTLYVCVPICAMRTSAAACEATSDCDWYATTLQCLPACNSVSSSATGCAQYYPRCVWAAHSCTANCMMKYATDQACLGATAACELRSVNGTAATCGQRCGTLGSYECAMWQPHCEWSQSVALYTYFGAAGRCHTRCPLRSNATCQQDAACMLFNGSCVTNCTQYTTAADCDLTPDESCFWSWTAGACMMPCALQHWDANQTIYMTLCDADGTLSCEWSVANAACERSCPSYAPPKAGSPAIPSAPAATICPATKCSYTGATDWLPTASGGVQYACVVAPSCGAFTSPAACATRVGCSWDAVASACLLYCAAYSVTNCPVGNVPSGFPCVVMPTKAAPQGTCRVSCSARHTTEASCNADLVACMYLDASCVASCGVFGTALCTGAGSSAHCEWSALGGECVQSCASRYATSPINCLSAVNCQWTGGTCGPQCYRSTSPSLCSATSCVWSNVTSRCTTRCTRYTLDSITIGTTNNGSAVRAAALKANCTRDPDQCEFSPTTLTCLQGCHDAQMNECGAGIYAHCYWAAALSACRMRCDQKYYTADATVRQRYCVADPNCTWVPAYSVAGIWGGYDNCFDNCAFKPTIKGDTACPASVLCLSNSVTGACEASCASRISPSWSSEQVINVCGALPNCKVQGTTCTETCATLTPAQCAADALCVLNGTVCQAGCSSYLTQHSCETSSAVACQWRFRTSSCARSCQSFGSNPTTCQQSPNCVFLTAKGNCSTACADYYDTNSSRYQAACAGDSACQWVSGHCYDRCAALDPTSCQLSTNNCYWDPHQKLCSVRCSQKYSNASACVSDPKCVWLPSTETCAESCAIATTRVECSALAYCVFIDVAKSCRVRCAVAAGNLSSLTAAAATVACNAISACVYYGSTCYDRCIGFGPTTCGTALAAAQCVWSDRMGQCAESCSVKYPNVATDPAQKTACQQDAVCALDHQAGSQGTCGSLCTNFLTLETCSAVSNCAWHDVVGACVQSCRSKWGADVVGCAADEGCTVLGNGTVCAERCEHQATAEGCDRISDCRFKGGACQPSCALLFAATDCLSAPALSSNCSLYGGVCSDRCAPFDLSSSFCISQGNGYCGWASDIGACRPTSCASFTQPLACVAESYYCEWDHPTGECRRLCSTINTSSVCGASVSCVWLSKSKQCVTSCLRRHEGGLFDRSGCSLDWQCEYFALSSPQPKCDVKCILRDFTSCNADAPTCFWSAGSQQCVRSCGYLHGVNSTACASDSSCLWLLSTQSCVQNCNLYRSSDACTLQPFCDWYDASATCELLCSAASIGTSGACSLNPRCQWVNATGTCERKCATAATIAQCNLGRAASALPSLSNECAWVSPNATLHMTLVASRANLSSLVDDIALSLGVAAANVSIHDVADGCNASVVDVTVVGDYGTVQGAIVTAAGWSEEPRSLASDVTVVAQAGSVPIPFSVASGAGRSGTRDAGVAAALISLSLFILLS